MKLTISKAGGKFVVDDASAKLGSPTVGRGSTMMEAIGRWVHANQAQLDIEFVVDETAKAAEQARRSRRARELAKDSPQNQEQ